MKGKRGGRVCLAGTALLVAVAAGCKVSEPLSSVQAPNKPNASGCPASQALGTFLAAGNVAAGFNTSGNTATYWFASLANENPANGVPGLIKYCVYSPSSTPTAISPLATGANGAAWTSNSGTQAFSFARPNGDPSNIPLDGAGTPISIGTATWTSIPTDQSILLHITDATVCAGLYGDGSQSCFVTPGQATVCVVNAGATNFAYNAIPFGAADCPGFSLGFEATSTSEFGDEVTLAGTARTLDSLTVLFASYGCETGHWFDGACSTTPGSMFTHPVTANIYSVKDCGGTPCVDQLLATVTQTLTVPLRPSADNVNCTGGDVGKWFNTIAGQCKNQVSVLRTFDFTQLVPTVTLPDNVIWTVAFNTTHYGAVPIGEGTICFNDVSGGGCPYDSFNVGSSTFSGAPYVGTDIDPNGAFLSSGAITSYCDNGAGGVGSLRLDTGSPCWSPYKPLGRIATH